MFPESQLWFSVWVRYKVTRAAPCTAPGQGCLITIRAARAQGRRAHPLLPLQEPVAQKGSPLPVPSREHQQLRPLPLRTLCRYNGAEQGCSGQLGTPSRAHPRSLGLFSHPHLHGMRNSRECCSCWKSCQHTKLLPLLRVLHCTQLGTNPRWGRGGATSLLVLHKYPKTRHTHTGGGVINGL